MMRKIVIKVLLDTGILASQQGNDTEMKGRLVHPVPLVIDSWLQPGQDNRYWNTPWNSLHSSRLDKYEGPLADYWHIPRLNLSTIFIGANVSSSKHDHLHGKWPTFHVLCFSPNMHTIYLIPPTHTPGKNGCHFPDDIFRCILLNEKFCILVKISLKFVPKGPIDNNLSLV